MSFFLLSALPIYLCLVIFSSLGANVKIARVVYYVLWGVLCYIPIYLFSRLIPDSDFFPWSVLQVFFSEAFSSRQAFSRIVVATILLVVVLRRKQIVYANELLCCLSGYFLAENLHDFLLLGPLPNERELFFEPLLRILFAQFFAVALNGLQRRSGNQAAILQFLVYLAAAFILLNIISALAIMLNAHWVMALVLLVILSLFFVTHHQFSKSIN